ncbi:hypothetical protein PROQFM164_S02g002983 [Penicillium roqueforti FM164]|uniref:Uncharacterized protein n=1 Tax=Penicillium roqueforti (strain FM164) TaxID=1365484 RepID=W6QTH2_PENRF|nr:hypothetical protein PROQFM164_S02g002983 [Penicillium roqueforti FM164]
MIREQPIQFILMTKMDHPTSPSPIDRPAKRQCRQVTNGTTIEPKIPARIRGTLTAEFMKVVNLNDSLAIPVLKLLDLYFCLCFLSLLTHVKSLLYIPLYFPTAFDGQSYTRNERIEREWSIPVSLIGVCANITDYDLDLDLYAICLSGFKWTGPDHLANSTRASDIFLHILALLFPKEVHWIEFRFMRFDRVSDRTIGKGLFFLLRVETAMGNLYRIRR